MSLLRHMACILVMALGALFLVSARAAAPEPEPWKFLVFSDSQANDGSYFFNTNLLSELARASVQEKPAFVLFGGDMANWPDETVPKAWATIFEPVYAAGIKVYPDVGNHDLPILEDFRRVFGPGLPDNGPEGEIGLTYVVRHQNALVLVLNQFVDPGFYHVNQAWVDAVLRSNALPHVFAISHTPAFKLQHADCLGQYAVERNAFWTSLTRAGARLYFCGHDHFYDHTRIDDGDGNPFNDLHQFILGTAGAPFYPDSDYDGDNGVWTPVRICHEENHGYLRVEVEGQRVCATWVRRIDSDSFTAGADVLCYSIGADATRLRVDPSPGGVTLLWTGDAVLEFAPALTGVFQAIPGAASPHTVSNATGHSGFFRLRMNP